MDRRNFMAAMGLAAGGLAAGPAPARASGGAAEVALDYGRPAHEISRGIYGHFIEELGKCIQGGIWRPVAGADQFLGGVPWDLIEAVKKLGPSLIRYPGGCFADNYHWRDGIGPGETRVVKPNLFWGRTNKEVGPDVSNRFGTDEFILFCREVGADPMITVNVGTGTAREAAAWVEYCNGAASTEWGAARARNGHPAPFGVKWWFVGNEMWNPADGGFTPERYAKLYLDFAAAMRAADPEIKLFLSGWDEGTNRWNRKVMAAAGHEADYLSIHCYYPPHLTSAEGRLKKKYSYNSIFRGLGRFERSWDRGLAAIAEHGRDREVKVSFDEWNLWFYGKEVIQTNYNLRDGLFVAAVLSRLQRRADQVPIANLAQMVNCIGLIISDKRGAYLTPSAWAFNLYTQAGLDQYLPITLSPETPADLEISATRDNTGDHLSLFLVNTNRLQPRDVRITLSNFRPGPQAQLSILHHPDPMKYNTFAEPNAVTPQTLTPTLDLTNQNEQSAFTLQLPAHSLSVIRLRKS